MTKTKKLLLGLGSVGVVVAPVATVMSCGTDKAEDTTTTGTGTAAGTGTNAGTGTAAGTGTTTGTGTGVAVPIANSQADADIQFVKAAIEAIPASTAVRTFDLDLQAEKKLTTTTLDFFGVDTTFMADARGTELKISWAEMNTDGAFNFNISIAKPGGITETVVVPVEITGTDAYNAIEAAKETQHVSLEFGPGYNFLNDSNKHATDVDKNEVIDASYPTGLTTAEFELKGLLNVDLAFAKFHTAATYSHPAIGASDTSFQMTVSFTSNKYPSSLGPFNTKTYTVNL